MTLCLRKDAVGGCVALLVMVFAAFTLPAWATNSGRAFEVRDVAVDVTADNAAAARDEALADGERRAFEALLDRIVPPDARANVPKASPEDIRDTVADFSIRGEKTSAVRYIATLDFRFDPDAVQAFLVSRGVPFVTMPSAPVVLVPVLAAPGTLTLWDSPNPWRDAWDSSPPSGALVPIVLPEGGLGDVSTISAEKAASGDFERLTNLADRYQAEGAVVSIARLVTDSRSGTSVVIIKTTRYGDSGAAWSAEKTLKANDGETPEALLARAVAAVEGEIESRWKSGATVDTGGGSVVDVTVPISGIRDWLQVRRTLENSVVVRSIDIVQLSRNEVRLKLHYVGDLEQLSTALGKSDLTLALKSGQWVLEPPSAGDGDT